jgi:hypothetical protein
MSKVAVAEAFPDPPTKRTDLAIELISGSVGGAAQVLIGQVSSHNCAGVSPYVQADNTSLWTH